MTHFSSILIALCSSTKISIKINGGIILIYNIFVPLFVSMPLYRIVHDISTGWISFDEEYQRRKLFLANVWCTTFIAIEYFVTWNNIIIVKILKKIVWLDNFSSNFICLKPARKFDYQNFKISTWRMPNFWSVFP